MFRCYLFVKEGGVAAVTPRPQRRSGSSKQPNKRTAYGIRQATANLCRTRDKGTLTNYQRQTGKQNKKVSPPAQAHTPSRRPTPHLFFVGLVVRGGRIVAVTAVTAVLAAAAAAAAAATATTLAISVSRSGSRFHLPQRQQQHISDKWKQVETGGVCFRGKR